MDEETNNLLCGQLADALESCLEQMRQMEHSFEDQDGTIAAAIESGETALAAFYATGAELVTAEEA